MKHLICVCLACVMIFAIAGCGQETVSPTIATVTPMEETTVTEPVDIPTMPQISEPSEEVIPAVTETQEQPTTTPTEEIDGTEASEHKHSYTSKVTQTPTCINSGVITYTCKECGYSYSTILDPLDHAYIITKN